MASCDKFRESERFNKFSKIYEVCRNSGVVLLNTFENYKNYSDTINMICECGKCFNKKAKHIDTAVKIMCRKCKHNINGREKSEYLISKQVKVWDKIEYEMGLEVISTISQYIDNRTVTFICPDCRNPTTKSSQSVLKGSNKCTKCSRIICDSEGGRPNTSITLRNHYNSKKVDSKYSGVLYIIYSHVLGLYKIGITKNIKSRIHTISRDTAGRVDIIYKIGSQYNNIALLESELHSKFNNYNVIPDVKKYGLTKTKKHNIGYTEWYSTEILEDINTFVMDKTLNGPFNLI